ncbi:class II glutamine amidotransferase [Shewanella fidelis]|uniref:Class II glutamine amidotransferase n=1 Tax=Shewanella fidelis TaxID=173509 RepID=A0AAW8NMV9_9GAMM|nr:class II glutamine amidotransferase [Shewanella fidelis]MDR8524052.1 class II glutamine amidotransferase [Shewanella fidelis]MDW4810599.1 class II glutamine amidotransferase [Shewanella fidelis]MDW4814720.1 class II glutamine amidotransferase [Shewanella fidelis]MDW4818810.1 class II glutamine amidotransferase [Shewanella fidelis]MDW4823513.1 class II glutamine amidotransferase [Shewanella fidelis]
MCELLAMSANVPTDIVFSFTGLAERGGVTGPHVDGWGITFYEGKGSRTFKDARPSSESHVAQLIKSYPIKSEVVVSHIRQANRGCVSLENTHPFTRELWGQYWTYAHNGQLTGYEDKFVAKRFTAVGDTDSEMAFCWIMDKVVERFGETAPEERLVVYDYIATLADEIRALGVFNMILSDGEHLMSYCTNNLCYITRRAPFGKAKLIDTDVVIDFDKETTPNDIVTVIATRPLTKDEQWNVLSPGEWKLFKKGELVSS